MSVIRGLGCHRGTPARASPHAAARPWQWLTRRGKKEGTAAPGGPPVSLNMPHTALHYAPVSLADLPALADLRVAAMRESLEALGRFDPERARQRLIEGFVPEHARHIETETERIGFYVLQPERDALHLKHLYFWPRHSGQGHGRMVMQALQAQARAAGLPLRLNALRGSRANDFYRACGFIEAHADPLDVYYRWLP